MTISRLLLAPPLAVLLAGWLASCGSADPGVAGEGASWAEADRLWRRGDPRWLGADAAYSIPLGGQRVLWLFGDTFVATSGRHVRAESKMVRNTVAIQDGLDPATARFTPVWRTDADGAPAPFFAGDGELGHWPGHGIRLPGGPLVVFLSIVRNTPGQGLGFASAGWRAVLIDDPDSPPQTWRPRVLEPAPQAFDAQVGAAVARDGEHVVALAPADSGEHATFVARFPLASLAAGELGAIQWWDGRDWTRALAGRPRVVIFEGATEASLHLDAALGRWVYVASRGFPASSIAVRTAPRPEGPWSAPAVLFTPPESRQPGAFVYAAKAHPELTAVGLAVTYADNSFDFADLLDPAREARLYWPHFATLRLRAPP